MEKIPTLFAGKHDQGRGIVKQFNTKGMKIHFSLPKDEGFFNAYATLTPTLYRLGFLAQLISAMTEIGILYSLIYTTLIDAFPEFAHPAALLGAVIGTAFLEVGLRKFLPYSFRAILFKRFGGLHRVMSLFILLVSVGLLFSSGLLSFKGSKDLVAAVAPAPDQLGTGLADSLYQQQTNAIGNRFDGQAQALRAKYKAAIAVQGQQLKKYEEREKRTGLSYITRKTRIKAKIAELQAEEADKLAELEIERAQLLGGAEQRHLQGLEKVERQNDETKLESELAIGRYGGGLAWFTVVCLFVLVLSIALDEVHKKGSGIDSKALPDQYHFSQSIRAELINMLAEKWHYFTRSWIRRQADRTPPPMQPQPLPLLYEMADIRSRRIKIRAASAPDPEESFYQLSANAGNGYEKLFEPEINASNSVPARPVVQGFNRPSPGDQQKTNDPTNAIRYLKEENVVIKEVDKDAKPCRQCGEYFRPKTTWQKYCSSECRGNFHAEKHGRRFNPGKYHKARKKKNKIK